MVSQLNRAVVSIASNIAEENSRSTAKDKARFVEIAYGSLMEVPCQLEIAKELKLIDGTELETCRNEIKIVAIKLSRHKRYYLEGNK